MALRALRAEAPSTGREAHRRSPEEVGRRTSELLGEQGWCRWQCELLDGDIIVVLDEMVAREIPEGHATYTVGELFLLLKVDEATIRLIHEAKKLGGAVVLEVVRLSDAGEVTS